MYKILAVDIDDTLLNDELTITSLTKQALEQAIAQGTLVTLATGRMHASAKQVASQLNLNVPIISYQGALVENMLDDAVLYERDIPSDAAKRIIDYALSRGLHLQAYYNDELYAYEDNDKIKMYSRMSNVPYKIEADFSFFYDKPLAKLLIIDDPGKLEEIMDDLMPELGKQIHMTKSKPTFLEFMNKEGTKGHALEYLARHYHCSMDQVIAIGDSWNDREMLEVAGLGVAMENAVPALKEMANYVTASNNDDGIAQVIERFILQGEA